MTHYNRPVPVTKTPFAGYSAAPYVESLQYDVGSIPGPSPRYNSGEDTVHHVKAPPHLSSYTEPEYIYDGRRDAVANINPPQRPGAWKNVGNNFVDDAREPSWSYNSCPPNDDSNGLSAALPPPNGYNSQNTPSYPCSATVNLPGHYTGYCDPRSTPSNAADNFERSGMTPAIPYSAAYRATVASQRVVQASQNRRKEGVSLFACDECGATLTSHQNLRHHLNAHYNIKPFSCEHCQKSFGTAHDRSRHAKTCGAKKQSGIRFFHFNECMLEN
ncbi:hypothetical protein E1B28_010935 [Marasmius oreades]|uniref:C2H2-type domain-containing protein n=1 Tax=Marasmius oreades TaxID=181124 RepID=A0A9P7UQP2_9AGAR|nr:uncharacterized protein E1B28_010935 [Marasmius oreades]KAG7089236.1 hypothetical protein E1B28_010935 [Marasmius oreades]